MKKSVLVLLSCALVTAVAAPSFGQSLGEVARREAERRAQLRGGAKKITSADVPSTPAPTMPARPVPVVDPKAATAEAEKKDAAPAPVLPPPPAREKRPEAVWREQAKNLRDRLERIQRDINGIETRILSIQQMQQSAQGSAVTSLAGDLELANKDLERFKNELRLIQDEQTKFEDKARAAKIPEAWIR